LAKYAQSLDTGMQNLIKSAIHLTYFMRGGVQYESVLDRTFFERKMMLDFINERIEYENSKLKQSKGKLPPIY